MKTYIIKGCSPSIIEDLLECVKKGKNAGLYKFNELPVTVKYETKNKYDVVTVDKDTLIEIVQGHLKRLKNINLEIITRS